MSSSFSIAAVGDISFAGRYEDIPWNEVFNGLIPFFKKSNLVIANLESPLGLVGNSVEGKCPLCGNPGWANVLKESGISILSLANNHMMDYGLEGLFSTMTALEEAGIQYVGAGADKAAANKPLFIENKGIRLGILGRTGVIVSSPCYAETGRPGVAFLDVDEAREGIRECKAQSNITIIVLHWGVEEYSYPSPRQLSIARELISAGADIILGHHPHVLQGLEKIDGRLVAYSLGNFLFNNIEWCFVDKEGQRQEKIVKLSEENRKAGVLKVVISERHIESYEFIPTYIDPDGSVRVENTVQRQREFSRLCSRLHWPAYSALWRLYSLRQEWKLRLKPMTIGRLKWANLKKVRPKHFREFWEGLRRSGKITSEKSTNPYE